MFKAMKIIESVVISTAVLAMLVVTNNKVFAASLALSNADLVTPPTNVTISGICSDLQQCKPDSVITVLAPEGFSSRYVTNDTGFDITKSVYTILPDQNVVWNSASKYSFFNNQEISPDGKTLTFSNGVFPVGTVGLFTRVNDIPTKFTVSIEGKPSSTSVGEPSITIGVLAVSFLSIVSRKKVLSLRKCNV